MPLVFWARVLSSYRMLVSMFWGWAVRICGVSDWARVCWRVVGFVGAPALGVRVGSPWLGRLVRVLVWLVLRELR